MPSDVTREEFEARVGVLAREIEGEKLVTRHILEQTRRASDELAAIKTRLGRVEAKLDGVDLRLGAVEQKLGAVDGRLGALEQTLPELIATALQRVLGARNGER